jgi:protein O-GlcNAc transferase
VTVDPSQAARAAVTAGVAHHAAGRLDVAEAAMREAVRLDPANLNAAANLGAILRGRGRAAEALGVYDAALAITPDAASVLINRANLLNDLKRWPEALASAEGALLHAAQNAGAHNARGNAFLSLGQRPEAIASYREATRLAPGYVDAWFNLGKALALSGDASAALEAYDEATRLQPGSAGAHARRGHALLQLRRPTEAVAAYDRAFDLEPARDYLAGQRLHARMKLCDWRDFDGLVADIARRIDAGSRAATPFTIVSAPLSPARQRRCAETYAADTFLSSPRPRPPAPGPRLRVGYFSADLHEHATAHLIAEMLELHDRETFEISAFSYGPDSAGPMRRRLQAACERFVDVRSLDDRAICQMAGDLGLDIAIDLKGMTADSRPQIFAAGVAPIQVSYLGFPMTLGAPFMDYLIADRVLVAEDQTGFYAEKLAWLEGCYQPNDRKRAISPVATTRGDHGLPFQGFVFASFNGSYKITPQTFGVWMEILQAAPYAVLWLLEDEAAAAKNLRAEAAARGVDPDRLVFAPRRPLAEHLERIAHADLFLDTFPCCAHTTASDALWAGLPLLTRKGATFASRVAASLLTAVDIPELIVESAEAYRSTALALAADPQRLRSVRQRVAQARTGSPLFDTPAYVRRIEELYRRMHARRLAGLPPDHLP